MAAGLHVPCSLDGRAGGGAERCLRGPVSIGRGEGGALGPGVWGGGAVALKPTCWIPRACPSPLAETVDGEALWRPSLRSFSCSLLPGLGSLPPRTVTLPLLLWPPPRRGFPDDAPPDCVLSYLQNRARGTDVPILWLFLENRGNDFLNLTLSEEKRNLSLLQPQAPVCPPLLGQQ